MKIDSEILLIAKEAVVVHKLVKFAAKDLCVSDTVGYPYRTNVIVGAPIKVDSFNDETISGLHSYKEAISLVKEQEDGSKIYKLTDIFNIRVAPSYNLYDGIFVIPRDSTYTINKHGEVVSDKLMYLGEFKKL